MRDIKFRVWDDKYKYMNYKVLVGMWGNNVLDEGNYTACSMWIDPKNVDYKCEPHWAHFEPYDEEIKLMQYTGMNDIDGIEIYEGDIIYNLDNDCRYLVKWSDASFVLYSKCNYKNKLEWADTLGNLTALYSTIVIGNIYRDKELLG